MRAIILLALLAGCATLTPESEKYYAAEYVARTYVEWVRVADPNAVCQALQHRDNFTYLACTQHAVDYSWCKVFSREDATTWYLGDEFKHCFGYRHPE